MNIKQRIQRLQAFLSEERLDGIVINKPENRRYFSGFTGTAGMLVITDGKAVLVTDFRYVEQAAEQAADFEILRHGASIYETAGKLASDLGLQRIGFESDFVSFETHQQLSKALPQAELVPVKLDTFRQVKDAGELALIQKAVAIADAAFTHVLGCLKPGMREMDVAFELECMMRKLGSEKPAFDTIVASGKRSALPHGRASEKVLETGDFVTMDFGAVFQGYHSDMTRTVVIGRATPKQREVYDTVLTAQLAGIRAVCAGRLCKAVDAEARQVITNAGYGDYFGHGLGHSLGLVIHEDPRLAPANADGVLAENMVVTVEPGIYLPDWGGVRIEDTVVVTAAGCDILTTGSKQLIEIDGE